MPAERALLPRDIRIILKWWAERKAIPTRRQIARQIGVSEATVARIARNGGYKPKKPKRDIEALARSIDTKKSVEHGTEQNVSLQGDGCTQSQP